MFRTADWDDVLWTGAVFHDGGPNDVAGVIDEFRSRILCQSSTRFDKVGFILVAAIAKLTAC